MTTGGPATTYYVDEAGDGVLFGRKGRVRINEPNARKFFMLGMVRCKDDASAADTLDTEKIASGQPPLHRNSFHVTRSRKNGPFFSRYALWALQRCYEKGEDRFLRSIRDKVSVIRDVDDPNGKHYGTYYTRKTSPPDIQTIKNRWV